MHTKAIGVTAKRDRAAHAAMRSFAKEGLDAGAGEAGPQTRIDEQSKDKANQATLLRTGGDYATSSSAAADTSGTNPSRGRKTDTDHDKDKSKKIDRERSPRLIQHSDL